MDGALATLRSHMSRHVRRAVIGITVAVITFLSLVQPASAHGFTSTVYVHATTSGENRIRTTLELEYDLFIVSAADYEKDDPLFRAGDAAFDAGDTAGQAAALNSHA